jgi:hypothetical protein
MNPRILALSLSALCIGCGEKAKQAKDTANALQVLAKSAESMAASSNEAQKFLDDRKAKGDTVAMPYKDLQAFLPGSINGYTNDGGPTGQTMNMGAFSMTTTEQKYQSGSDPDVKRLHVTIADYSGSQAGYAMMAPYMAMTMSSEDDHHRTGTMKVDVPYTFAIEEFNKDTKDSKVTLGTRYRYFITVEASGQKGDESRMVAEIATDIAKKLAGK